MAWNLTDLTRRELHNLMETGIDTAVIPLGATEQHGEALPFSTDTIIGELVGEKFAEKINGVLVPAMPFGLSLEHIGVPGTINISAATLTAVIREIGLSLAQNGFKKLIFIVAHFGNASPAAIAAQEIVAQTQAIVGVSSYLSGMEAKSAEILGLKPGELDWAYFYSHAGAAEAAFVMARDEGLVHLDTAEAFPPTRANIFSDPAMLYPGPVEEVSPTGMWGDPREISPGLGQGVTGEIGRKLIDACTDVLAEKFRNMIGEVEEARQIMTSS